MSVRTARAFLVAAVFAVGVIGCTSAGYLTKPPLVVPKTIRAPATIPPELVPHVPRFVESLQAQGFSVGKTDDRRALDLVFEFNGNPFNLRVSVGLWNQGVPVLTASATNSGWGTAIARGTAVNSLAGKAGNQFDVQLAVLVSRTQIVPDAPQEEAPRIRDVRFGRPPGSPAPAQSPPDPAPDLGERAKLISLGFTPQEVENQLGKPERKFELETTTRWDYPDLIVIFEAGFVARVIPR